MVSYRVDAPRVQIGSRFGLGTKTGGFTMGLTTRSLIGLGAAGRVTRRSGVTLARIIVALETMAHMAIAVASEAEKI